MSTAENVVTMPLAEALECWAKEYHEIQFCVRGPYVADHVLKGLAEGLTQEQMAERVGKTQQWISYHEVYGRWRRWLTTNVVNPIFRPYELSEGKFRQFWLAHAELEPDTIARNRAVYEDALRRQEERDGWDKYAGLVDAIRKAGCQDGRKRRFEVIAEKTGFPVEHVTKFVANHQDRPEKFKLQILIPKGKSETCIISEKCTERVSKKTLLSRIKPLTDELRSYGDLHRVRVSPPRLKEIANIIEALIANIKTT